MSMTPKDCESLRRLLRGSLNEANYAYHAGYCTENAWRWFLMLWTWSAPRFSGSAGYKQERMYNRCGSDAYHRRLARISALAHKLGEQS